MYQEQTDAELDSMIAAQLQNLPDWWEEETSKDDKDQAENRFGWLGIRKRRRGRKDHTGRRPWLPAQGTLSYGTRNHSPHKGE